MRAERSSARSIAGAVAAVVVLGVVAIAPALACTARSSVAAKPARGEAGTTVQFTGTGFEPAGSPVSVRWGGATGDLLATTNVDESGSFAADITVPSSASGGSWYSITATQQRADGNFNTASFAFEVQGAPAPQQSPPQDPPPPQQPPSQPVQQAEPAQPQPAPTQAAAPAPKPAVTRSVTAAAPVAAPPAPADAAPADAAPAPAPAAPPVQPLDLSGEIRAADPAGIGFPADPPRVEPLVVADPAAMGGPRTIDGGPSAWLLAPLILVGLTLFSASSAVVVHEVRRRRMGAKVTV